ncbi:MAG: succinylglutamate desuccinylase/aspartoacylase family protein [Bacteroidetes bacterium]|jgi:predicted deacylase|nr:succinylglutamate desuccinylase/aspartoacylase family protein [Bacteroidota bacterium]MBP6639804.1 succinylglutamate desuccinylase/aspartoacylase family protein [Bacteroidia bacterium]
MSKPLVIQDFEVLPGERRDLSLTIARLPTHTEIHLPVYVFRGPIDGPVLLLTSSLHGDEVNGTETLRRMIRNGSLMPEVGTVIAMPVVNVYGFLHQSRALPDGKDLNRSFPGNQGGSLARRMAYILLNEVVVHADFGIDLHTGGARRTNFPQVRCDFEREESLQLAHAFGAPFVLNSKEIPGSFRRSATNAGKTIIVFEGGESQRFDERSINEAMDGIHRVMSHLSMVERRIPHRESLVLRRSTWIRAKISGMFVPFVQAGDGVIEGQVMAHVGDPFGETVLEVKAPIDGYIIGLNNQPVINAGDALIHIGTENVNLESFTEDDGSGDGADE